MRFHRSNPAMLMAMVGLFTAGLLAPVGANKAGADPGETRPGCGTYCQSAGQYGAPGGSGKYAVTIVSTGTVTPDSDGYVPVTLTCNLQIQCVGALLVELSGWSNTQDEMSWVTGRSDLVVNGGATQTIGVKVPAAAIGYVQSHGPTPLKVVADTNGMTQAYQDGFQTLNQAQLTMAAPG